MWQISVDGDGKHAHRRHIHDGLFTRQWRIQKSTQADKGIIILTRTVPFFFLFLFFSPQQHGVADCGFPGGTVGSGYLTMII